MQTEPTIEEGIPIPNWRMRGEGRRLVEKLEVGQSVIYPQSPRGHRHTLQLANSRAVAMKPRKFACRTMVQNGETILRVWRIK